MWLHQVLGLRATLPRTVCDKVEAVLFAPTCRCGRTGEFLRNHAYDNHDEYGIVYLCPVHLCKCQKPLAWATSAALCHVCFSSMCIDCGTGCHCILGNHKKTRVLGCYVKRGPDGYVIERKNPFGQGYPLQNQR